MLKIQALRDNNTLFNCDTILRINNCRINQSLITYFSTKRYLLHDNIGFILTLKNKTYD